MTPADIDALIHAASMARDRAYAPYSGFRVGAALLAASGRVYTGCNIENAAFSPTICAERVALGTAIASGEPPGAFTAIAIVADHDRPTSPCGVCRQMLFELAPGARVIMAAAPEKGSARLEMMPEQLLPYGFRLDV
jgi:cytidine deaminase